MGLDFNRTTSHGNADIHIDYEVLSDELVQVSFQFNRKAEINPIQFDYHYTIQTNADGSSDMEAIGLLKPTLFHIAEEAKIEANSPSLVHYPTNVQIGATLPNANFNYAITIGEVVFTHEGKIIERKVLKTFAATYKHQQLKGYLLSAKVIREASLNGHPFESTTTQLKEWFIPELGVVKQQRLIATNPIGFVDALDRASETETIALKDLKLNH